MEAGSVQAKQRGRVKAVRVGRDDETSPANLYGGSLRSLEVDDAVSYGNWRRRRRP